jgi:hypothetical protein
MCKDASEYQKELIRQSSAILQDCLTVLENGGALSEHSVDELQGLVLSQIQDVIDLSRAPDEAQMEEIMCRYQ